MTNKISINTNYKLGIGHLSSNIFFLLESFSLLNHLYYKFAVWVCVIGRFSRFGEIEKGF